MSLQNFPSMPSFEETKERFKDFFTLERRADGVVLAQAHTLGGPIQLSVENHRALGLMLKAVGADPENELLILTGSGKEFMMDADPDGFQIEEENMADWAYEYAYKDGRINVSSLVNDLEIPTIGILNGPGFHSEICQMCDISICADDATIFDLHYDIGSVPGDGIHTCFQELLGVKRAAYALLTGEAITPQKALEYGMICKADTVGVFQIESRAQMSMLPRLKPRCFYDLVIEVAIIRPGPIVGGMVHPYLNRRQGKEPVSYPSEALREALGRTLGVPIFQEQVMQIAILAAGFTAGEADGLRRAMAAWKRKGGLDRYHAKLVDGMTSRGYDLDFAENIFKQIHGFIEYGFPESHAASFALLVYASCWIKQHHPAEFLAAMLNSQPLGFYSPSQLVQDTKRHSVEVRAADVMLSDVDCTLEDLSHTPAVRLGLRMISGLKSESMERIVTARDERVFDSAEDLARRARLEQHEMKLLAGADALMSLSGHRRQQVWDAAALRSPPALLRNAAFDEDVLELPPAPEGEEILFDYASLGLTLRRHPMAQLRPKLEERRLMSAAQLEELPNGRLVRYCGIVTLRQQPETANGTVFISLEDETGVVQVICWKSLRDLQRRELLASRLLAVYGTWQREGDTKNLIARRLEDLTPLLGRLATESRDFH